MDLQSGGPAIGWAFYLLLGALPACLSRQARPGCSSMAFARGPSISPAMVANALVSPWRSFSRSDCSSVVARVKGGFRFSSPATATSRILSKVGWLVC